MEKFPDMKPVEAAPEKPKVAKKASAKKAAAGPSQEEIDAAIA